MATTFSISIFWITTDMRNMKKTLKRIRTGGLLLAVCSIAALCAWLVVEVIYLRSVSLDTFNMDEYLEMATRLDYFWMVAMLVAFAGCVMAVAGLGKIAPYLSPSAGTGLKRVRTGMSLFAVGVLISAIPGTMSEDQLFLQIYGTTVLIGAVAQFAGLIFMSVGFSGTSLVKVATIVLAILYGYSCYVQIFRITHPDLFGITHIYAIFQTLEVLPVKPGKIVGFVLFAAGWVKTVRALRYDTDHSNREAAPGICATEEKPGNTQWQTPN
jgi:hypothetical protein